MRAPGLVASRRVHPRLELPADDFLHLKACSARRRTTLGRLAGTRRGTGTGTGGPTLRSTAALPDELHTRLKVCATYACGIMQVLMRAALAPVLAEARAAEQAEVGQALAGGRHDRRHHI
jgi:hypothetical protein